MYILNIFTFIYYKKTPEICVITLLINPKVYSGDKKYALDKTAYMGLAGQTKLFVQILRLSN